MARKDASVDLLFGIIGLIVDVAIESSRSTSGGGLFSNSKHRGVGKSLARLEQMKEDHRTGGGPVYEPMKNRPVKTVSKADRMAAIAALKTGKTMTEVEHNEEKPLERKFYGLSSNAKQIKLEILLLNYMFQEDDGKISGKERRAIKNHYKDFIHKLSEEDVDYIKEIKHMDNSLLNIRSYISQQEVSDTDITNSIRTLKECNSDPKRYDSIINRIESALLETMGY